MIVRGQIFYNTFMNKLVNHPMAHVAVPHPPHEVVGILKIFELNKACEMKIKTRRL